MSVENQLRIDNVHIVDVARGAVDPRRSVLLEDGRIRGVLEPAANLPGEILEGEGRYLCPGLIDGHVHFFLDASPSPGTHFIENSEQAKMEVARENARLAIGAGITTVRDCGSPACLMFEFQKEVEQGRCPGPHILSCGSPLMRPGGHCHFFGGEVATVEEVRRRIDEQLHRGAGFVKLMASGGGLTPGTDPSEADLPLELICAAAEAAHANGVHVAAHCHATESIRRAIGAGVDTIEHVSFVEPPGQYRYDEEISCHIRDRGIVVSPTVIGALRTAQRVRQSGRSLNPKDLGAIGRLEGRLTNTGHFHQLGMRIVGGTDCGVTDTPFDSLVDELLAYTRAGMSNTEALRTVTCDSAAFLRLARVGEVKPAYRADLILLDENPLEDLNALRYPLLVFKEGGVIHRRGDETRTKRGPEFDPVRPHV